MPWSTAGPGRGPEGVDAGYGLSPRREPAAAETLHLLAFNLSGEWYAAETRYIRGIERETEITPIPRAPDWLVGVFNLRGTILPVVDAGSLLGVPRSDPPAQRLLVVLQGEDTTIAIRADLVDEMYEVLSTSLEPPIAPVEGARAGLIQGQVRVRDRLVGVLGVPAMMRALLEG